MQCPPSSRITTRGQTSAPMHPGNVLHAVSTCGHRATAAVSAARQGRGPSPRNARRATHEHAARAAHSPHSPRPMPTRTHRPCSPLWPCKRAAAAGGAPSDSRLAWWVVRAAARTLASPTSRRGARMASHYSRTIHTRSEGRFQQLVGIVMAWRIPASPNTRLAGGGLAIRAPRRPTPLCPRAPHHPPRRARAWRRRRRSRRAAARSRRPAAA